jgi:hypothetical protein
MGYILLFEDFKFINEVNWKDFSDVKKQCVEPKELTDFLNRVIQNREKTTKDREKFPDLPFVHSKSEFFDIESDNVDIDEFKKRITTPPNIILSANDKMEHSGGVDEFVYNMGVNQLLTKSLTILHNI